MQKGLTANRCALLKARGDSMEPTIYDGDILLIDTSVPKIVDDSIYVLQFDHNLLVKRVQSTIPGGLVIISDNLRYPQQMIEPYYWEKVKIIGRVRWYGHEI
jgi:phage repressor protein C with HTH and peptisase S24 domain